MKKKLVSILVAMVFALPVFMFSAGTVCAEPKVLKMQSTYPPLSQLADNTKFFAKKVEELTNGEVKIKIYWPGQLVGTKEVLSAVQKGMIDSVMTGLGYYFLGTIPEAAGVLLPYGWANTDEMVDIFLNHGYLDLMRTVGAQHGLYYVAPLSVGNQGFITKFPIRKLEDLKGKKIRASGMLGYAVEALGASTVALSPSEIYTALQRGTVDGTTYPWYTMKDYNFHEVASHICTPGILTPGICDIVFNLKVWESLTPKQKEAVNSAGLQAFMRSKKLNDKADEEAFAFCREHNVEITILSDAEIQRFKKAVKPVWEKHKKKTPLCAKQVEILEKYAAKRGAAKKAK